MTIRRVVIVTGASRGLGAAVASRLAAKDVAVTMVARSEMDLLGVEAGIRENGGRAVAIKADVTDVDACRRIVERSLDRWGRLDALVNNAGVLGPLAYTVDSDAAAWLETLKVNVMGPYNLARDTLPWLRKTGGRIVNVSSGAATKALAAAGAYCVSKAALNHFTRILSKEEPRVTSVAVRPGVVDTSMQKALREGSPSVMPEQQADFYRKLKDDGALEPPEVPGLSIAWLALHAPSDWSGRFLDYDDPDIARPAAAWIDEKAPEP